MTQNRSSAVMQQRAEPHDSLDDFPTPAAVAAGIIKQEEAARVLQMANQRYLAVAPAANAATSGLNKFTPAITNAGFQVQDFAVQVASGQSAMMAFAQQFPQLMGVLGFSGKLALAGAAIGTFAAVAFAVAPMLVKMSSKTRDYKDALDSLKAAQDGLNESLSLATMPLTDLYRIYGEGAGRVREMALAQLQLNVAVARGELVQSLAGLKEVTAEYTRLGITWSSTDRALEAIQRDFGLTGDAAWELRRRINELNAATSSEMQMKHFKELAAWLNEAGVPLEKMPPSLAKAAANMLNLNINAEELKALVAQATAETGGAVSSTYDWAAAMSGVRAEIYGIVSALSQIGGGMISRAAKFVELNALQAGKSLADARVEVEKFNTAAEYNGKILAAEGKGTFMGDIEAKAWRAAKALDISNIALDTNLDAQRKATAESERLAGRKGGSGAAASDKVSQSLDKEAQKWLDTIDPMNRYQREMSELLQLQGRLSKEDMAKAIKKLNGDLADSIPMVGEPPAEARVRNRRNLNAGNVFVGVLKDVRQPA
jgi:hypothetical protein